jgi:peptide/nickel transport system ATP-binding protein
MNNILKIKGLEVCFPSFHGKTYAVSDLGISLEKGEILGIVGESGAGKSTVGNAIINLLEPPGRITKGEVIFDGENIEKPSDSRIQSIRGQKIGMIFQDPQTSLNPLMTIGAQLCETVEKITDLKGVSIFNKAMDLLKSVGIDQPELRFSSYPHQFSGGMRQRVVIALALAGDPDLIIADEPTTALDVSIQAQILDLIKTICSKRKMGVILITHDIGVVATITDRVAVMLNGKLVEIGKTQKIINAPKHQYTKSLIAAVPRADRKIKRFKSVDYIEGSGKQAHRKININEDWLGKNIFDQDSNLAISVKGLRKDFIVKKAIFKKNRRYLGAVNNVSFEIKRGESFGLVGESGSGKSTIARLIAGLVKPDTGSIKIFGREITKKDLSSDLIKNSTKLQMIFQDPYSSLNSRMRVGDIVGEPIRYYKTASSLKEEINIVSGLLDHVGLSKNSIGKYPHEFSGGQRQRISIARALASRPKILVCDEPTSALDVSVQAHILNLLKDLQDELSLTILFISHDLPVIRQMCDRVAVMRNGAICEVAETETLFEIPKHAYSKHLLELMPRLNT